MTVETKDIITWMIMAVGFGGQIATTRIWIDRLSKIVFDTNGEVRVVTHAALSRIMSRCRETNELQCDNVRENITSIKFDLDKIRGSLNKHNTTDAAKHAEIHNCMIKITEKLELVCRGLE